MSWPMVPFGEILRIAPRELVESRDLPILSITMRDGLIDQDQKFKKRIASGDISTYKVVHKGNLVVGFPIDEGVLGFQHRYEAAAVSPAYDIWEATGKHQLHRGFFERVLRSPTARAVYVAKMRGTTNRRRTIPKDVFKKIMFPLPPLPEQKRIAGILDAADALRARRRESLDQLDTLLQSTFLDMFGDPVTNPMGWEVRKSSELFLVPPRIGTTTPAAGEGLLVVRVGEVGQSTIAFERCGRVEISDKDFEKFRLEPGDTVIARAIGSKNQLGKASYFSGSDEAIVIDSHVMRFRPDPSKCDGVWFYSLISSDRGKVLLQRAGGATAVQFNINAKQASSLPVAHPPRDLQHRFAAIVESVEKQKASQRAHLAELDTLFASLQSRAFRGDL